MDARLLSIPVALTGGAGGTYLGYKYLHQDTQKESIKSKLGTSLLGFDGSFDSKWKERSTLVTSKTGLHPSLEALRDANAKREISIEKIKNWCQSKSKEEFVSESDSLFQNIRSYCTYNNKDKLEDKAISEDLKNDKALQDDGQWSKANKRLREKQDNNMSGKMKEIKGKLSPSSGTADDKALKNWCESSYVEYFKDSKDPVFTDLEAYCTKVAGGNTESGQASS
ncbi:hypothetical protein HF1_13830 [Mycoplasma haemofelis str. Langford 1]|uniref:Uncharacterized protein n=1 Tax=Mycoplasma haemofelis (strain Langford 1) TaxID=941640 RepID=E8ZJS0_MYCHL|nr:hypothetical protein [Mycoplasma haemofelis]CBY93391.1 hypothetical protein HF1_13830 [Mycoplasma haemofelis str. Langford 1]